MKNGHDIYPDRGGYQHALDKAGLSVVFEYTLNRPKWQIDLIPDFEALLYERFELHLRTSFSLSAYLYQGLVYLTRTEFKAHQRRKALPPSEESRMI